MKNIVKIASLLLIVVVCTVNSSFSQSNRIPERQVIVPAINTTILGDNVLITQNGSSINVQIEGNLRTIPHVIEVNGRAIYKEYKGEFREHKKCCGGACWCIVCAKDFEKKCFVTN